jgi:hypothetical protein
MISRQSYDIRVVGRLGIKDVPIGMFLTHGTMSSNPVTNAAKSLTPMIPVGSSLSIVCVLQQFSRNLAAVSHTVPTANVAFNSKRGL